MQKVKRLLDLVIGSAVRTTRSDVVEDTRLVDVGLTDLRRGCGQTRVRPSNVGQAGTATIAHRSFSSDGGSSIWSIQSKAVPRCFFSHAATCAAHSTQVGRRFSYPNLKSAHFAHDV
jgi:hypothetical protein